MSDEEARRVKERSLRQEIARWSAEVGRALIRLENLKRRQVRLPPLPPRTSALLPHAGDSGLKLLNLKVWTLRYHVNLDFVLTFLLDVYFAKVRHPPDGGDVRLGVAVGSLTGAGARRALEEEVTRTFPSGENIKAAREEARQRVHPIEPLGLFPEDKNALRAYGEAMVKRQRLHRTQYVAKRNWRGNPDRVVVPGKD